MGGTFYAVQQVINGRPGVTSKIETLDGAIEFAYFLRSKSIGHEKDDFKIEYRIYEVKEVVLKGE
jgi:hypothetical protein